MSKIHGWQPRRRGPIYCSPLCGAGCKRKDFELATSRAKALAKRMGAGWQPVVWENMGWFYKIAKNDMAEIIPTGKFQSGSYTVHVALGPISQIFVTSRTPEQAFSKAVRKLRDYGRQIDDGLKQLQQ